MANGNLTYPSDNNQLPFREIQLRAGILYGLLCDVFSMELEKASPKLNFSEGMLIYYLGYNISLPIGRTDIKKLFEMNYITRAAEGITLSIAGIELRNNMNKALGMLEAPEETLNVFGALTETVALEKKLRLQ